MRKKIRIERNEGKEGRGRIINGKVGEEKKKETMRNKDRENFKKKRKKEEELIAK